MLEETKVSLCKSGLCNKCPNLMRRSSYAIGGKERENVYCDHFQTSRMIELSLAVNQDIKQPDWCPIKQEINLKKKINDGIKLTDGEKRALLMERTPITCWDDIKFDTVYHIPPLLGEKRKDIVVTYKGQYSCTYRVLSKNASSGTIDTFYPSSLMSRFLIPHKFASVKQIKK